MNSRSALDQMISQQVRAWEVLDLPILDAMRKVPREQFVPPAWRSVAFADTALPLAHGKRMLPPMLVGRILTALSLRGGEAALEVGTGSGYLSACMAALGARVRSIELHEELATQARSNLRSAGFVEVEVLQADGMTLAGAASFDCVVLTASLPIWQPRFADLLRDGGRLFTVVGAGVMMEALLIQKLGNTLQRRVLFETSLEALENAPRPPAFEF